MAIELSKDARAAAISSLDRYSRENMDEPIGNIAAAALLDFFLEEIGPSIYNKAIMDAQDNLQKRVMELDMDVHEEEFQYWHKAGRSQKSRKK